MPQEVDEVLVRPLGEVLARLGEGVAQAQQAMDLNSIATQTLIDNDPVLSEYGLQATWYHMPEVTLELKMSLALKRETVTDQSGRPRISKLSVLAAPYNAKVQNTLALDVQGTSTVKVRIVSIPPPPRPEG
ncbi:hypothetical protein KO353_15095 [Elioraea tepida]|uniref:Uncharacterized protein n=1 Tax=Elioraea tepida TaxID=2843330 RepID=A0A975U376_9PROT|nr:hypothetical protein [Elioraea tepida]QXM24543.1 hypothetical protein KO353_15095 [Elioraea tepida]